MIEHLYSSPRGPWLVIWCLYDLFMFLELCCDIFPWVPDLDRTHLRAWLVYDWIGGVTTTLKERSGNEFNSFNKCLGKSILCMNMRYRVLNFDSHCHAIIIQRLWSKFSGVVHSNRLYTIIREIIPHLYDLWDQFCKGMVPCWQQANIGPFRGSINEHHEVPKRPREGLNWTAYVPLDTFQERGDFIPHLEGRWPND